MIMPPHTRYYSERFAECKKAIEDSLLELLGDAIDAGWTKDEVLAATIAVADETALALNAHVLLSVETEMKQFMKRRD